MVRRQSESASFVTLGPAGSRRLDPSSASRARVNTRKALLTAIPAEVIAVDRKSDQFHVIVRIALSTYRGSFDTLVFGASKPLFGSCHDGRLDLIYPEDPGFQAGEEFPLWTIQ